MGKDSEQTRGIAYASFAYFMWGFLPLYWKFIDNVPSDQILAHRVLWSFVFMLVVLGVRNKWGQFRAEFQRIRTSSKQFLSLMAASVIISSNWFIYIWAVNAGHIIEASLGYYINPLINVLLGILVLKERLNFWQIVSVILAAAGVLILTVRFGSIPWIALSLALTFALYGLAKKLTNLDSMTGLTVETMLITPVALLYLIALGWNGNNVFLTESFITTLLLMGAGAVTALPLLYFAKGAKLISLSLIGFLQYIGPTISLCLGVFLFHEHFTSTHMIAFFCIWCALTIFSVSKTKFMIGIQLKLKKSAKAS